MKTSIHPRVASALEQSHTSFRIHRHIDYAPEIGSPGQFASCLGYELKRITKSLFVRCTSGEKYAVVVCSMPDKIDFAAVAGAIGCKKVEVARPHELEQKLGYPPRGVSPLGVGDVPVLVDERLFEMPTVLIGSGETGIEIEMAPADLQDVAKAVRATITR
jgi:Cys-tRNA(Pro)/Cys-tRNA(Cys) deacylase